MARYKKTENELIGKIVEEIAILKESDRSDWVVALAKISWHDKDPKIEIRNYNKHKEDAPGGVAFGSGVALTDDMLEILTEELINLGYGNTKSILKELKTRDDYPVKKKIKSE